MQVQYKTILQKLLQNETLIGICAGFAVALTTSIWSVATRFAVTTSLMPHDVTLIRFSVASFFLWPIFLFSFRSYLQVKAVPLILMLVGAGIPFMWIASTGLTYAPVAHVSTLMIVMMPVFVSILSWIVFREALAKWQILGICTVLIGVLLIAGRGLVMNRQSGEWVGDLMFLTAGLLFATFTVTQKRSGLTPWQATALVNVGSTVLFLPIYYLQRTTGFSEASSQEIIIQILSQGIGAALLGIYFYAVAVSRLGAQRAAIFLALVPPLSITMGAIFLDEQPTTTAIVGIAVVMIGVLAVVSGKKKELPNGGEIDKNSRLMTERI